MDEDNDTSFRGATEGSNICSKWVTGTSQYDQFRVQSAGYYVIGDVVAGLLQFSVFRSPRPSYQVVVVNSRWYTVVVNFITRDLILTALELASAETTSSYEV